MNKRCNKMKFCLSMVFFSFAFYSTSISSSSSSDKILPGNCASSTSKSVISNAFAVFYCSLNMVMCSLSALYPSAQGFPGLKQLICSSSSPLPSIVKAHFLKEDSIISLGRAFQAFKIQSRTNLRGTGFMLPLSVNS